jgi:hypothetical protein
LKAEEGTNRMMMKSTMSTNLGLFVLILTCWGCLIILFDVAPTVLAQNGQTNNENDKLGWVTDKDNNNFNTNDSDNNDGNDNDNNNNNINAAPVPAPVVPFTAAAPTTAATDPPTPPVTADENTATNNDNEKLGWATGNSNSNNNDNDNNSGSDNDAAPVPAPAVPFTAAAPTTAATDPPTPPITADENTATNNDNNNNSDNNNDSDNDAAPVPAPVVPFTDAAPTTAATDPPTLPGNAVDAAQPTTAAECPLKCNNGGVCKQGNSDFNEHPKEIDETPFTFLQTTNREGWYCDCPYGYTGLRCNRKYEKCPIISTETNNIHFCYHDGQCIDGLTDGSHDKIDIKERFCDCSLAQHNDVPYFGKYCEIEGAVRCDPTSQVFCTAQGTCKDGYENKAHPCDCLEGHRGAHCEFVRGSVSLSPSFRKMYISRMIFIVVIFIAGKNEY